MVVCLCQEFDGPEELKAKVETLAQLIKESQYLVVHSGAGIRLFVLSFQQRQVRNKLT